MTQAPHEAIVHIMSMVSDIQTKSLVETEKVPLKVCTIKHKMRM